MEEDSAEALRDQSCQMYPLLKSLEAPRESYQLEIVKSYTIVLVISSVWMQYFLRKKRKEIGLIRLKLKGDLS